jgi:hypothetical protein
MATVRGPKSKDSEAPLVVWPPPLKVGEELYFLVRLTLDWLALFLTGDKAFKRALYRYSCFDELKTAVLKAERATEGGAGLARGRKRKKAPTEAAPLDISVPYGPQSPNTRELRGFRLQKEWYLKLSSSSLGWLFEWCNQEQAAPRNTYQPNEGDQVSPVKRVFFSRTESAWVARAGGRRWLFKVGRFDADGRLLGAEAYRSQLEAQRSAAERHLANLSSDNNSGQHVSTKGARKDSGHTLARASSVSDGASTELDDWGSGVGVSDPF